MFWPTILRRGVIRDKMVRENRKQNNSPYSRIDKGLFIFSNDGRLIVLDYRRHPGKTPQEDLLWTLDANVGVERGSA